jgi:hypothetical protein
MCDIALYTKKLKVLNLGGNAIPTSLAVVLIKSDGIVELNISGCVSVSSSLLTVLSESCPNLHVLNVVDCSIDVGAFNLITKASSVRKLIVGNSRGPLPGGFFNLCKNATELIVWHSPRMALSDIAFQLPYVTKFSVFAATTNFEFNEANSLLTYWPDLVYLSICAIVSERFAMYLAQSCQHLQHLSIIDSLPANPNECAADYEMVEQPPGPRPLRTACFGQLSPNNMCLLFRECPHLVRFELFDLCLPSEDGTDSQRSDEQDDEDEDEEDEEMMWEDEIDDEDNEDADQEEEEVDETGDEEEEEEDGDEPDIEDEEDDEDEENAGPPAPPWDTELLALTLPTSLHTLSIQNCALLDNRHLVFLRGLTSLSLAGNNTITDEGIIVTLAQNPTLCVLRIRDFKLVTHVSVLAAVRSCPLLVEIEFSVRGGAVAHYVQRELILGLIHELRPGLKIVNIRF